MTVAFDAATASGLDSGNRNFDHTPVGTPAAAVAVVTAFDIYDVPGASCTYGGVSMAQIANSPVYRLSGEVGVVFIFLLDSSVPSGTQTVSVTPISGIGLTACSVTTLTASAAIELVDSDFVSSSSQSNPSVTLAAASRACFAMLGFVSGQGAVSGVTPLTSWSAIFEADFGAGVSGSYIYDAIGTSDITAGVTQTADDIMLLAAAFSEVVSSAPTLSDHKVTNVTATSVRGTYDYAF